MLVAKSLHEHIMDITIGILNGTVVQLSGIQASLLVIYRFRE